MTLVVEMEPQFLTYSQVIGELSRSSIYNPGYRYKSQLLVSDRCMAMLIIIRTLDVA
jgi:hypothetical protein